MSNAQEHRVFPAYETTVAQIADLWHPFNVKRIYSADGPETGWIILDLLMDGMGNDTCCKDKGEALSYARRWKEEQELLEHQIWQMLSNAYEEHPDRNVHYRDLIVEITGQMPRVARISPDMVLASVAPYCCSSCGKLHRIPLMDEMTIDEALEHLAQAVYAQYQQCCAQHSKEVFYGVVHISDSSLWK